MSDCLNTKNVGIGCVCVAGGRAELTAHALGSCIALCMYDWKTGVGAMAHILLPARSYSGREVAEGPLQTQYADHALDSALDGMLKLGASMGRIRAAVVGGAEMFTHGSIPTLNIGKMNFESITQELNKRGIPLLYAETGGTRSRTVTYTLPGSSFEEQIAIRSRNTRAFA